MKIAIIAHLHFPIAEPYLGGTEMHTATVADELVRRGHDVTLFAKGGSRTRARLVPILEEGWTFGSRPGPGGVDRTQEELLAAVSGAIRDIRTGDFDVVLNNSFGPLPYTMLTDWPMLTILHTPPTLQRVNAVILRPDWRPGERHAYVGVSEFNAQAWRKVLPNVECIPNGIHLDHWRGTGPVEEGLAVWVGRITPEKGLHQAIAAARLAGMRLEFSGPISDPEYFRTRIVPELDDTVSYIGHCPHDELADLLARGSVFLASPLWPEPFGLVMVEAMASGTPVAALPHGAAPEVVGSRGGNIAADGSVEALAEAVKIARDLDRSVVRAHAQRYDARVMVERYEQVLTRLLGERAPQHVSVG
jgi:glycosyltransferase involved in cell wall biosynthesis